MHAVSQIFERNLRNRSISRGRTLWINPEKDETWRKAESCCDSLGLFSQDFGNRSYLELSGADIEFAAFPLSPDDKYDWVILNLPRQKALLRMMLDCVAGLLADDGLLWLAGENKAGVKSAGRLLKLHFSRVRKLDNARHCTLFEASGALKGQPFDPLNYRERWTLDCPGTGAIDVISYPGVFAHGRVDAGSALLLETLVDERIEGDVLDFACGAGVIGACVAAAGTCSSMTLLDTNALALKACEETLEINAIEGAVLASDGLSGLDGSFDLVVTNPPIHSGVKTDNRLSIRLLESIHQHIRPDGRLILVANVHLPYEKWLSESFRHTRALAANNSYKVVMARK